MACLELIEIALSDHGIVEAVFIVGARPGEIVQMPYIC